MWSCPFFKPPYHPRSHMKAVYGSVLDLWHFSLCPQRRRPFQGDPKIPKWHQRKLRQPQYRRTMSPLKRYLSRLFSCS